MLADPPICKIDTAGFSNGVSNGMLGGGEGGAGKRFDKPVGRQTPPATAEENGSNFAPHSQSIPPQEDVERLTEHDKIKEKWAPKDGTKGEITEHAEPDSLTAEGVSSTS